MVHVRVVSRLRSTAWIAALAAAAFLSACGGGDSDSSIDLRSFTLSSSSIAVPASGTSTTINATWSASASGVAATGYHVSAHAIAAGAAKTLTDANKFLGRNCSAAATCGDPQSQACTFSSSGVLSCGIGTSVTLSPGSYTIVAQACGYDEKLNDVCSSRKETTLLVQ